MNSYIPERPLHHALNYIPFNYSIDPNWGLIPLLATTSEYIQKLKKESPSFSNDTKWFYLESEESYKTYGIIELGLEEFIFGMMDGEIFDIISTKLNLTIYQKGGDIGTSKFSANDFFSVIESMIRQLIIDQVLKDLN